MCPPMCGKAISPPPQARARLPLRAPSYWPQMATPFRTTADPFNPKPESFPPSQGIETGLNNRTRRAWTLLTADRSITDDKFRAYKFDNCYTPDSEFALLVKGIGARNYAGDPLLEEAGEILRRYNVCTNKTNRRRCARADDRLHRSCRPRRAARRALTPARSYARPQPGCCRSSDGSIRPGRR